MKKYMLTLCLFVTGVLSAQENGDALFDDSFLHEIHFHSVDTLLYINEKTYEQVDMTFDGEIVEGIGFKRKGNISGNPSTNKFPIKVKTNKYVQDQTYDGVKEFMLHMNYEDPTMLREKLTYEICEQLGLNYLRSAFAKVYINDVYWGLYTILEGKDEMYKRVFDNRDANAMETSEFGNLCYEGPNVSDYEVFDFLAYDNDNGDFDTAWSSFIAMLEAANNTPDDQYIEQVSQHLNLEDFFKQQAMNVYLVNADSYITFGGNQRFVYDDAAGIWQINPWDYNASFGLWNTFNYSVETYPALPNFDCIAERMESIPELKQMYFNAMCQLRMICDEETMGARIDVLANQIEQAVMEDTRKVISMQDFENGLGYGYFQLLDDAQPALKTVLQKREEVATAALIQQNQDCTFSIQNAPTTWREIRVFPNPARQYVQFDLNDAASGTWNYSIFDVRGVEVISAQSSNNQLFVGHLATGVYSIVAHGGRQHFQGRFLKQ